MIGNEIRKRAIDQGLTLGQLATQSGLKYPYFSKRLNGHKDFTIGELEQIAQTLGTHAWQIMQTHHNPALAATVNEGEEQ